MRDSIGGSVTIVIIVFFIVVALGYLAFNVNYTKAFRMKDKIISMYEDFDGVCGPGSDCEHALSTYANNIGYSTDRNLNCPNSNSFEYRNVDNLYCVATVAVSKGDGVAGDDRLKIYYKIVTKINLKIPVISNIFDFRFFYISGNTRIFILNNKGDENS